jgi:hypothetical protein
MESRFAVHIQRYQVRPCLSCTTADISNVNLAPRTLETPDLGFAFLVTSQTEAAVPACIEVTQYDIVIADGRRVLDGDAQSMRNKLVNVV